MGWNEPQGGSTAAVDVNAEIRRELQQGDISEEKARSTFGRFLSYNLGLLVFMLTGFILPAYQRIMVKGWMQKNFCLTVAARSLGKSMAFSHFCYLYCLTHPDHHIIMVAPTFRSSRRVLENIETWARRKRGGLLRQCIQTTKQGELLTKRQDMYKITFINGSTIIALPLGDADNLRGFRCNVLGIDEGLLIPQSTINVVLKPFLAGAADATQKQLTRIREDRDIAAGQMSEKERKVFPSTSKMIILSSASYKFEELYEVYKQYRTIIERTDPKADELAERTDSGISTYLVHQLSYKIIKPELMDPAILREIREKLIPQAIIDREYGAQFVDESGGFFSARQMDECTIKSGDRPCIEIVGEKGAEYVLGIDPNMESSPTADDFAMCVIKIIERGTDKKKMGLVVHQYACHEADLKFHFAYLHYILKSFNIVYIVCDCSHGENMDFISVCNESEYFKSRKIELNAIEAEFAKEDFSATVADVKRSYNPDSSIRQIVQKQYFATNIIKAGNDYLRACFSQKSIWFASGAQSCGIVHQLAGADVMGMNDHPEFRDKGADVAGNMHEFVCYQDVMMDIVKKECALIEFSTTALGTPSFDLPSHIARNRKNPRRIRKDSYSALWLAVWGLKIYLAVQEAPPEQSNDTFTPVLI